MKNGLVTKLTQNVHSYKALEAPGDTLLVEASPYNKLWDAGLGINDPDLANAQLWKGDNLMGDILGDIRK